MVQHSEELLQLLLIQRSCSFNAFINPEMLPQDVAKVIQMTAIDMGTPGKDERYGAGKLTPLRRQIHLSL